MDWPFKGYPRPRDYVPEGEEYLKIYPPRDPGE